MQGLSFEEGSLPANGTKIAIVGVGRLGLSMALVLAWKGFDVLGVDVSAEYVRSLNDKSFQSPEPGITALLQHVTSFRATTKLEEALAFSDLIWILVATPTGVSEKAYDHSQLSRVLVAINKANVCDKHVIIGCTVLPGYTRNTGRFLLEDCVNTTLNYNPEFVAQGEIIRGLLAPDMVLIGQETEEAGRRIQAVYETFLNLESHSYRQMSVESAEICKLAVNCFITTKITFANMIGDLADQLEGASAVDILGAVGQDERVGSKCLRPGYGFGGPCFPRDNRALGVFMQSQGVQPLIPRATDAYNKVHAIHMANQLEATGQEVFVFEDVAYKPKCAVPIVEESQKLAVAHLLVKRGKRVIIRDREAIILATKMEFGRVFDYEVVPTEHKEP